MGEHKPGTKRPFGTDEDYLSFTYGQHAVTYYRNVASQYWPDLRPPEHVAMKLPEFPRAAFPPGVQEWVEGISRHLGAPPYLAAMLAIAAGAAAAGTRVRIRDAAGRTQPLSLSTAVATESSPRQAALLEAALAPHFEWEGRLLENIAFERIEVGPVRELHAPPRFLIDPPAALTREAFLLRGALAPFSGSGGILRDLAGRNSVALREEMRILEAAHEGRTTTVQQGKKYFQVKGPAAACGLAIEPALLVDLAKNRRFAGKSLLNRFLFALPASTLGNREPAAAALPELAAVEYRMAMRNLLTLTGDWIMTLAPEAAQLLRSFEVEIEPQLAKKGTLAGLPQWGALLPSSVLRLAGILHLFTSDPATPVGERSMQGAIEIGRYLIPHATAAFERMGLLEAGPEDDVVILIRWLENQKQRTISVRDVHQSLRRKLSPEQIEAGFDDLAKRGYVRRNRDAASGGRPYSPHYDVSPAVFGEPTPKQPRRSLFGDLAPTPESPPPEPPPATPPASPPSSQRKRRHGEEALKWADDTLKAFYHRMQPLVRSVRRKRQRLTKHKLRAEKLARRVHKSPQTQEKRQFPATAAMGTPPTGPSR